MRTGLKRAYVQQNVYGERGVRSNFRLHIRYTVYSILFGCSLFSGTLLYKFCRIVHPRTWRHIPAKTSLTQWRFFKKCRIEDIFCFVSVFTQIFFKLIGNLWAYYKCNLGRMHHVGTWAFTQQRVFTESPQSNLNYFRQQAFHDSKPIEQMRLFITLRKNILYGM